MDEQSSKDIKLKYSALIADCWQDDQEKAHFIQDPIGTLKERGIPVDETKKYKVIEAEKRSRYIVLPYEESQTALTILYKELNGFCAKGNQIIKQDCELRLIQNTNDTIYLVIPYSPSLYTEEERLTLEKSSGYAETETVLFVALEEIHVAVTTTLIEGEIFVVGVVVLI